MKFYHILSLFLCALLISCSNGQKQTPRAKHVILLGFDAMSARGIQRAHTPNFNRLIENGALSLKTRCIRPTSSSQNWISMVTGANIEMHGVTDNDWEPDKIIIEPAVKNKKGLFPTIFDDIKTQRPDAKVYMFYEWTSQDRMYDTSVADKVVTGLDGDETFLQATDAFFKDKPEFLFVSIDVPDHIGHKYGHESKEYFESITHYDKMVGDFINKLEETKLLDESVVIITADHGGLGTSHGGDSESELEIPIIMYGKGVTKGKVMERTNLICDIAATVGGLLGVELPQECVGKFISEAFEPKGDKIYVPMPFIAPFEGFYKEKTTITITGDIEGGEIYYTLDGSTPTNNSTRYNGPFELKHTAIIKAIVYKNGQHSKIADVMIRVAPNDLIPTVHYQLYENLKGESLPDFNTLRPVKSGYVHEFSLEELGVETKDHFGVVFNSKIEITEAGKYTFGISSDDGSKLFINGKEVINHDGSHSATMKYGIIDLNKGTHNIKVEYFDDYSGQKLEVYYKSANLPLQMIPFSKLSK